MILYQGESFELMKYSSTYYSDTARRLTNLFQAPQVVSIEERFFEEGLIHRTANGKLVRSKSEVIIANCLHSKNIKFLYEEKLVAPDGSYRYPDFTIKDDESGTVYYWEHVGMLSDPKYKQSWGQKLAWYKAQNIVKHEDGGGTNGTLIVSYDDDQGGIDSQEIDAKIDTILGS